jgi:hypothetical protein
MQQGLVLAQVPGRQQARGWGLGFRRQRQQSQEPLIVFV